jgi:aspartate/methionine/tyrosine aminotransferase
VADSVRPSVASDRRLALRVRRSAVCPDRQRPRSQSTSCAASISQAAALAALRTDARFLSEWVATYRARRDAALALVERIPGLSC